MPRVRICTVVTTCVAACAPATMRPAADAGSDVDAGPSADAGASADDDDDRRLEQHDGQATWVVALSRRR